MWSEFLQFTLRPLKGKTMIDTRGHTQKTKGNANAKKIRDIMTRNPFARPKDVIAITGLHPVTVSKHLKALGIEAEKAGGDG